MGNISISSKDISTITEALDTHKGFDMRVPLYMERSSHFLCFATVSNTEIAYILKRAKESRTTVSLDIQPHARVIYFEFINTK